MTALRVWLVRHDLHGFPNTFRATGIWQTGLTALAVALIAAAGARRRQVPRITATITETSIVNFGDDREHGAGG